MSQLFPEIPEFPPNNVMVATEFDLMKREPLHHYFVGYSQVSVPKNLSAF